MIKTKRLSSRQKNPKLGGQAMYMRKIRPKLAGEKKGRIVAMDMLSGDYEVADDPLAAAESLLARRPKADIWFERVGYRAMVHFRSPFRLPAVVRISVNYSYGPCNRTIPPAYY